MSPAWSLSVGLKPGAQGPGLPPNASAGLEMFGVVENVIASSECCSGSITVEDDFTKSFTESL